MTSFALAFPTDVQLIYVRNDVVGGMVTFVLSNGAKLTEWWSGTGAAAFEVLGDSGVRQVEVGAADGLWIDGGASATYTYIGADRQRHFEALEPSGTLLLWQRGKVAYRLEGALSSTTRCGSRRRSRRPGLGPAVVLLALAQVARELGGERVAGRKVLLLLDLLGALLELLDVRRGLGVGGDGLAHLLGVRLARLFELVRVDLRLEQLAEPVAERERGARARRERDVVRHGRPQARRREARVLARVVEHADDPGRPLVARGLEAEALDQLRVGGAPGDRRRVACAGRRRAASRA